MSKAKELDQFFTTLKIAENCVEKLETVIPDLGYENFSFLEPSAGDGVFLDAAFNKGYNAVGFDIDPKKDEIYYADFINDDLTKIADFDSQKNLVVIGNPPFGKRAKLAIDFVNKSFQYSDTVAFVLPIQFMKYLTMKNINKEARLVVNDVIPPDSFTFEGKPYSVRCVFQVWTKRLIHETSLTDYRIYSSPKTSHADFELFSYNCVPSALWMFQHDWDFAVHRQGWAEFKPIEKSDDLKLDTKKQWMFFKSDNDEVLENLKKIDYNKLGEKNTSVRGFGKADVVEEYERLFGSGEGKISSGRSSTLF